MDPLDFSNYNKNCFQEDDNFLDNYGNITKIWNEHKMKSHEPNHPGIYKNTLQMGFKLDRTILHSPAIRNTKQFFYIPG